MELVTAHFWVDDNLYEVDYDKAIAHNGWARLFRVYKSERRCQCPERAVLERQRRKPYPGLSQVPR